MMTEFTYCDMDMRWPSPSLPWARCPYYRFNALALNASIGFGGWARGGVGVDPLLATENKDL